MHIPGMDFRAHQLVSLLLAQKGLNPNAAARAMCASLSFQPTLHKFLQGHVASPKRSTAERIAKFLDLPVDAIYDHKLAHSIAKERGLLPAAQAPEGQLAGAQVGSGERLLQALEVRENVVRYAVDSGGFDPFPAELRQRVAALGKEQRTALFSTINTLLLGYEAASAASSKQLAN